MTYVDLFAGCGGLSLGMHNAGWKGLFAIEKSVDAFSTLKFNLIDNKGHFDWPEWLPQKNLDINRVLDEYSEQIKNLKGKVDLVVGGPPCQGFSVAGRRKEEDSRNTLIKSYLKFIMHVKPKAILFENVKGFTLMFEKNKTKGLIYSEYVLRALKFFGYEVQGEMVDFSKFGIPQKRSRFILVGIRKDIAYANRVTSKDFFEKIIHEKRQFSEIRNLPQNPTLGCAISDLLRQHGTIPTPDRKNFFSGIYSIAETTYQEYLRKENQANIPNSHSFPKHKPEIINRFECFLLNKNSNKKISKEIKQMYQLKKSTIVPLASHLPTPTLTTLPDDYIHYCEPRILTVREYARVQSFPDWFEFKGKYTTGGDKRINEVPRYTQIGNAIPPLFGEQCGLVLKKLVN